jgi:hypothetical protein
MNEAKYKKHLTIWIVVTVVLVVVSFYAGSKHGQNTTKNAFAQARGGAGQMGGRAGGRFAAGGGVVMGSVISKDDTSMTVKMRDGSSKIVLYSGSTQVSKSAAGTAGDVAVGTTISVIGTQNTDGSVTASTIQIRPAMPTPTPAATTPAQ